MGARATQLVAKKADRGKIIMQISLCGILERRIRIVESRATFLRTMTALHLGSR
jgi:hypothetical protein